MTNAGRGAVADASVAIKWRLNDEELLDEARLLLHRFLSREIVLAAPSFIRYELANSLEEARRRRRITHDQVLEGLRYFLELGVHSDADSDELLESAAQIALQLDVSVYDAVYVALAEELDLTLVSNDQRLLQRVSDYPIASCALKEVRSLL